MLSIKNKTCIITGGSSGIGLAIATALVEKGAHVISADIKAPPEEMGVNYFKTDITEGKEVADLYKYVADSRGEADVIVCNAGVGLLERLDEGDPEKWGRIINVNITGNLRIIRAFLPGLKMKGEGNILFISSISGDYTYPYGGVYSASKAALNSIAATLRKELCERIKITVISPGVVDTPFFENMLSGNASVEAIGFGALSPSDIAEAVLFSIESTGFNVSKITMVPSGQIL
jgi:NADP-dependent 3-hydroxy acid dehydrogenase YdfG